MPMNGFEPIDSREMGTSVGHLANRLSANGGLMHGEKVIWLMRHFAANRIEKRRFANPDLT